MHSHVHFPELRITKAQPDPCLVELSAAWTAPAGQPVFCPW
jgi:hypothetical protein